MLRFFTLLPVKILDCFITGKWFIIKNFTEAIKNPPSFRGKKEDYER